MKHCPALECENAISKCKDEIEIVLDDYNRNMFPQLVKHLI